MKHRTLASILVIVMGTGCFLGAFAYAVHYATHTADIQSQWPAVPGNIPGASDFVEDEGYLWIIVQFEYSVDDINYTHKQKLLVGVFCSQEDKDKVTLKYSPGSIVPVYYDPQNHKQAVIDPRQVTEWPTVYWIVYILLFLGGPITAGLGIMLLVKTTPSK